MVPPSLVQRPISVRVEVLVEKRIRKDEHGKGRVWECVDTWTTEESLRLDGTKNLTEDDMISPSCGLKPRSKVVRI